eukprot:758893-Hanusia_phi.AAC.2
MRTRRGAMGHTRSSCRSSVVSRRPLFGFSTSSIRSSLGWTPANRSEKSYPALRDALALLCNKANRMLEGQMSLRQSEILSMQAEVDTVRAVQKELERFAIASDH